MADVNVRLDQNSAIQTIFNDTSKTISDLKTREWTATTVSGGGIIGLVTFSHSSGTPRYLITVFVALILVGHALVYWRCTTNLDTFRKRLRTALKDRFPIETHNLFDKDFENAIVDEGMIAAVAFGLVWLAALFAVADIWKWFRL